MWLFSLNAVQWETFEGEKFHELVKNTIFMEKTFVDCSLLLCQRTPRSQISQRKLLWIATKPWNSRTFSPLKVLRYMVAWSLLYVLYTCTSLSLYISPHIWYLSQLLALKVSFLSDCNFFSSSKKIFIRTITGWWCSCAVFDIILLHSHCTLMICTTWSSKSCEAENLVNIKRWKNLFARLMWTLYQGSR